MVNADVSRPFPHGDTGRFKGAPIYLPPSDDPPFSRRIPGSVSLHESAGMGVALVGPRPRIGTPQFQGAPIYFPPAMLPQSPKGSRNMQPPILRKGRKLVLLGPALIAMCTSRIREAVSAKNAHAANGLRSLNYRYRPVAVGAEKHSSLAGCDRRRNPTTSGWTKRRCRSALYPAPYGQLSGGADIFPPYRRSAVSPTVSGVGTPPLRQAWEYQEFCSAPRAIRLNCGEFSPAPPPPLAPARG